MSPREKLMKVCLFRAQHRGSREADLVIGGFASTQLSSLDNKDLKLFSTLLTWEDGDIFNWIKEDSLSTDSDLRQALKAFQQNFELPP